MSSAGIIQDSVVRNRSSSRITAERMNEDGKKVANRFAGLTVNKTVSEKIALEAMAKMAGMDENTNDQIFDLNAPMLRPASEKARLTKDARLLALLAEFNQNNASNSDASLVTKLSATLAGAEARKARFENAAAQLEEINAELENAQSELDNAIGDLAAKQQLLEAARARLAQAQKSLQQLKEAGVDESDPRFMAAAAEVAAAEGGVTSAQKAVADATARADAQAEKTQALVDKHAATIKELTQAATNERGKAVVASAGLTAAQEKSETILKRMVLLLTALINILNEGNAKKLQNDLSLNQARADGLRKTMLKKAAEYEEKLRKAEEAAKKTSCIGKIVGGIVSAIGIGLALFDGGTTLVIGLTIIAVTTAMDYIKVNGKSLMEHTMGFIMEKILSPVMEQIGKLILKIMDTTKITAALLKKYGEEKTEQIKNWVKVGVTVVVTAAALIAAMFLSGKAAKVITDGASKLIQKSIVQNVVKMVKDLIPQFIKNIVNGISKTAAQAYKYLNETIFKKLQQQGNRYAVEKTGQVMLMAGNAVNTAVQAGGSILSAKGYADAQKMLAASRISENQLEQLTKELEVLLERLTRHDDFTNSLQKQAGALQEQNNATAKYIARKTRV